MSKSFEICRKFVNSPESCQDARVFWVCILAPHPVGVDPRDKFRSDNVLEARAGLDVDFAPPLAKHFDTFKVPPPNAYF